jgi:hypothetical protein
VDIATHIMGFVPMVRTVRGADIHQIVKVDFVLIYIAVLRRVIWVLLVLSRILVKADIAISTFGAVLMGLTARSVDMGQIVRAGNALIIFVVIRLVR